MLILADKPALYLLALRQCQVSYSPLYAHGVLCRQYPFNIVKIVPGFGTRDIRYFTEASFLFFHSSKTEAFSSAVNVRLIQNLRNPMFSHNCCVDQLNLQLLFNIYRSRRASFNALRSCRISDSSSSHRVGTVEYRALFWQVVTHCPKVLHRKR